MKKKDKLKKYSTKLIYITFIVALLGIFSVLCAFDSYTKYKTERNQNEKCIIAFNNIDNNNASVKQISGIKEYCIFSINMYKKLNLNILYLGILISFCCLAFSFFYLRAWLILRKKNITLVSSIVLIIVGVFYLSMTIYKYPKYKIENAKEKINYFNNIDMHNASSTEINKMKNFCVANVEMPENFKLETFKISIVASILCLIISIINLILWNGLRKIE